MHIVLTIHHELDSNSGAPGSTLALAESYERAGHDVRLLSFDDLPSRLGVQLRMLAFPLLVARHLARPHARRCDVVDASSGDAWLWSLRRRPGGPLLVTRSHGLEHREHLERLQDEHDGLVALRRRYRLYHGGERLRQVAVSFRRADLALFLNQDDLDFAVERLGVDPVRARVVRYGLPDRLVGLAPPVAADPIRLAVIAWHTDGMGRRYSVPALDALLSRHPQLRVSLLGTGLAPADVLADFSPPLRPRIEVVPAFERADLPSLLAGHEILLSAKTSEGFGKAVLEAMACGLVPVASAASGPARIVENGRTGLLVPSRDAAALIEAVERLLADDQLRLRLRHDAHAAAQRWSEEEAFAERLALIEAALEVRAARGRRAGEPQPDRLVSAPPPSGA